MVLIANAASAPPRRARSVDPGLQAWLEHANQAAANKAASPETPAMARAALASLTRFMAAPGPALPLVQDITLSEAPTVAARLYDPSPGTSLPFIMYLHGGGHMAGSVEVYDPICRRLALMAQCRVLAVEYHLAPEHPYPQGLHDCARVLAALPSWLTERGDTQPCGITVAGDSGGGALTATLAAMAASDEKLPNISHQVLIYPSLDYTLAQPSIQENAQGYLLELPRIRWYFDHYFAAGQDRSAASPLCMPAHGLPRTLIFTAGYCPLRDEGYAYAARLHEAGVACTHLHLPGMIHAFLNLHRLVPEACDAVYAAIGEFVRA